MTATSQVSKKLYCKCGRFLAKFRVLESKNVEKSVVIVELDTRCVICRKDRLFILDAVTAKEL